MWFDRDKDDFHQFFFKDIIVSYKKKKNTKNSITSPTGSISEGLEIHPSPEQGVKKL